jgi:poly[(R)-3-hydroxyalkanoate] polymerase subunit PhaC
MAAPGGKRDAERKATEAGRRVTGRQTRARRSAQKRDGRSRGSGPAAVGAGEARVADATGAAASGSDSSANRTAARGEEHGQHPDAVAEEASSAILGANPFVGVDVNGIIGATGRWVGSLGRRPAGVMGRMASSALDLGKIALGRSEIGPGRGDRRFTDPAWSANPGYRRMMQSYLLTAWTLQALVEDAELDDKSEQRARFALTLLTDALAPTNVLLGNPAALKHAFDTAGVSLARGARNLVSDIKNNGAMPSMVDKRPFEVGGNLALTPGGVVYQDEILELIQYTPSTDTVYQRPLILIPPQINKYYILDIAPGRSFIEYAVSQGVPVFAISWRNPTAENRDWGLDSYVQAVLSAIDAGTEISGSDDCNLFGACAGGITMALLLGHLAATGSSRVNSATLAVTIMDTEAPSMIGMFASRSTIESAMRRSQRRGYLDGSEMSRIFAWLRPNDLVWNYWVNNYLMGNDPPAFDILYWNADNTRLPAALHADFLRLFEGNPLMERGAITVLGTPIDLHQVRIPSYVLAGVTDHIVPWTAAFGATRVLGGETRFVLSSSGHIQSLVNPPGNPKASYRVDGPDVEDPHVWLGGATERRGSWWEHWASWIGERSGERVSRAPGLGSRRYPPLGTAPGSYVHQS